MDQGLVYVFSGEGKGKTSAAVGMAVRAIGIQMKVGWVAWYKQVSWQLSEMKVLENMGVSIHILGKGFHITKGKRENNALNNAIKTAPLTNGGFVVDTVTDDEHVAAAQEALRVAKTQIGKVDLLILDEINNAIADKLIAIDEVLKLIEARGKTHIILTGRGVHAKLADVADLVTEMKKIKHPYDKGILAVRGLDF